MARDIFLITENSGLQVQSPFALANQEIPPDQYFHRKEAWYIFDLSWLIYIQNSKLICGIG